MRQDILTLKDVNIDDVIEKFIYNFEPCGKLVAANGTIHVYIIEYFFYRIGSEVAATVIFEFKGQNDLVVHIAIAGGRDILGVSLGAQGSMLKKLKKFFVKLNE